MPTIIASPNPAKPSETVTVTGEGFDPKRKIRLLLDGQGATTNIFRPARTGTFYVGINVSSSPRTQTLVAQDAISLSTLASTSIIVQNVIQPPTTGYTFEDNFDSNLSKWGHHYTCCGSVKVDSALTYVAGGQLHIRAENRSGTWYSGLVDTVGTFTQQYGKFEASITVPQGAGLWPAFWLYAGTFGVDGDEIDIVELLGKEKMQGAHQTVHKGIQSNEIYAPWTAIIPPNGGSTWADGKPHVFAVDWRADHIAFLIDGRETWRESNLLITKPLSIILNLGVGGWAGNPDATTPSPVEMLADYVRVSV